LLICTSTILYALKVLKPVLEGYASSVEPKREAEVTYIRRVQDSLKDSVFNAGCTTVNSSSPKAALDEKLTY